MYEILFTDGTICIATFHGGEYRDNEGFFLNEKLIEKVRKM